MLDPEEYGRIVSPALLHDNTIYFTGFGHHTIFPMEKKGVLRCATQGFVTENGYFVNREDALYIAKYYNQIGEIKYPPLDFLLSEDLKKEKIKIRQFNERYLYVEKDQKRI